MAGHGRGGRSYGGSSRNSSSARSIPSGKSGNRSYSANTRSFIAGKVAGQYQAKGYSKAHAQHIGNKVVSKAGKTFRSGSGSTPSWTAGVVTGRNQELYGFGLSRSTHIGNATIRKQTAARVQANRQMSTQSLIGANTTLVKNVGRARSPMVPWSAPRRPRRVSKLRFQLQSKISTLPTLGASSQSRSKVLGFARTAATPLPLTASLPSTNTGPVSKIIGWNPAATAPMPESKIIAFAPASTFSAAETGTGLLPGGSG
jgi:hypothetical protein